MSSIMSQIKGKSGNNNKQDWTKDHIRLAVGMKLEGAKRSDIETATGHPANSVTYLFNRKLTKPQLDENGKQVIELRTNKKDEQVEVKVRRQLEDDELFEACGVESIEEIIEYAHSILGAATDDDDDAEDDVEATA